MGRNANISGVHRHGANNGMGQQGDRNPLSRIGPFGRRLHAQKGAKAQISVRAQRQGVLLKREKRFFMSDLFYDVK